MAGSATLDPSKLVDSLVPVADELRTELHDDFGVRSYKIFTVLRTWSGRSIGEGVKTDVETEILDPYPKVHIWDGLRYTLEPCGLDEIGQVKLSEWSLTYTEAEVIGPPSMTKAQEWLIRIDEGHGQESLPKYFTLQKPPFIDRIKTLGWIVWLRRVS